MAVVKKIDFSDKTVCILKPESIVTSKESGALKKELVAMNGFKEMIVDLSDVVSIGDDFINALISVRVEQFQNFRKITLVNPSEIVGQMLEAGQIGQLYKIKHIHSTVW